MTSGVKGYDKGVNLEQLLALPFEEGVGLITQDVAHPHHPVAMSVVPPTWVARANGRGMLEFNGLSNYLKCLNAESADLNFTSGDYSIVSWINWVDTGSSEIIIGRYDLNVDGWELYLWNNVLQLRHNHVTFCPVDQVPCPPGFPRTGAYSYNWTPGVWWLMGVSRSGISARMYRNGQSLVVGASTGGLYADRCALF